MLAVGDTEAAMRNFMKAGGWSFPVMVASDDIAAAYEVQAVPTLFVIDSEGRIVDKLVGGATAQKLSRLVGELVS